MNKEPQHILEPGEARGAGGYEVNTGALVRYAGNTAGLAEALKDLGSQKVGMVRNLADDSFGKVGKDSGFAAALNHFAGALQQQLKGVATTSNRFGRSVARIASRYDEHDTTRAGAFRPNDGRTVLVEGGGED